MKKYKDFSSSDFIADDAFQKWVLTPDSENDRFWKEWLEKHPEKKIEVEAAIGIIESLKFEEASLNTFQKERLLERINTSIEKKKSQQSFQFRPTSRKRFRLVAGGIAASLTILFLLNFFPFLPDTGQITVRTPYAEKKELLLPDGSTIILNANSAVTYLEDWDDISEREIWLEGEAFFKVEKISNEENESIPFVVHSENLDIKVLGTSFNVGERRGHTEVTLLTGKVKLENKLKKDDTRYLEPGEHAEVSISDQEIKKKEVDVDKYSSWIDNKIIFEKTRLLEIKNVLQDQFGYEVVFGDEEIKSRKFTGIIKTDNLDIFLQTLEISFDVEVTKQEGKIILTKN